MTKLFLDPNIFGPKIFFNPIYILPKIILDRNIIRPKIVLDPNFFVDTEKVDDAIHEHLQSRPCLDGHQLPPPTQTIVMSTA